MLASLFWIWFCGFGPLLGTPPRTSSTVLLTALVLYALTWPALTVFALRRRWAGHHLSSALNIMALVPLAFQLVRIGSFECKRLQATPPPPIPPFTPLLHPASTPNIYFIVLDGYAREDVMRELYGYDNTAFLRGLETAGFQVAHHARTNYCQTVLSLSSCLNLGYLDGLARDMGPDAVDRTPLARAVDHNETTRFLRSQGYQIVAFASGYEGTAMTSADVYRTELGRVSEFQSTLLETTPLMFLGHALGVSHETPGVAHARQVLYTLDRLPQAGRMASPSSSLRTSSPPTPPSCFTPTGR